ncbi:hypothetical protein HPB51_028008 [Rhipicephalus microplus]|uniref:Uncharacterized protein n=1 Tax=Rhipicephalus microplus TaxID=6941 RepID=A0A9J6CYP5_RHIMP|nr:hypothetical protein HPB51_028008 [Rhipicephalus microplus]
MKIEVDGVDISLEEWFNQISGVERYQGGALWTGFTRERARRIALSPRKSGDASAAVNSADVDRYRPVCTSSNDQVCQINNCLPYCNKLLFDINLELREQRGGLLSLASIHEELVPFAVPEPHRAIPFLRWLLKTTYASPHSRYGTARGSHTAQTVLQELPENSRIKTLTLHLFEEDCSAQGHVTKHLPRLRSLEVLSFSGMCACAEATNDISTLLRSTKCLYFPGDPIVFRVQPATQNTYRRSGHQLDAKVG